MAGIWERVKPDAADRVASHLIDAIFVFKHTGTFSDSQILSSLNKTLQSPLNASEITDLTNISTALSNTSGVANKLVYLEKIKAVFFMW